jgi:hypothetical protein
VHVLNVQTVIDPFEISKEHDGYFALGQDHPAGTPALPETALNFEFLDDPALLLLVM